MKATGPTKLETRKLAAELEKHAKKTKQKIFLVLSREIGKPRRLRAAVNLRKLGKLAQANAKKVLVVPGKVLSLGNATAGMQVAAFSFSIEAKKKILEAKGKAISLKELAESKIKANETVLVK